MRNGRLDGAGLDVAHRGTGIGRQVARRRPGWDKPNESRRGPLLAPGAD
ncbi:hypothetical protein ACIBSV_37430 [Embleya sp. NPDC050154]